MRRTKPERRKVSPDVKYNSELLQHFINRVLKNGKKSTAARIVYTALDMVESRVKHDPLETFEQAIGNVQPILEVKPQRIGGATYQVPVEVTPNRRMTLAMRWILQAAHSRPGKSMSEKLAMEIMDAAKKTGAAIKKREETHRMAEANRAFANYRW
jgi:small subunit ribosomal protein S7